MDYTQYFEYQPKRGDSYIIEDEEDLKELAEKMMEVEEFAFDTETNTLRVYGPNKDFRLVDISISWGDDDNYLIPIGHRREEDLERQLPLEVVVKHLKPVFEREDVRIIGANLKFDFHVLDRVGIQYKTKDLFDTVLASWAIDENTPNGLKENTEMYLQIPQEHFAEVVNTVPKEVKKDFGLKASQKATIDLVLIEAGAPYALDDAFYTYKLYEGMKELMTELGLNKVYYNVQIPFLHTLFRMEKCGVTIKKDYLDYMRDGVKKDLEELEYRMLEIAGVQLNFNSSAQLALLLFGTVPQEPSKSDKKKHEEWESKAEIAEKYSFNFPIQEKTASGAPATSSSVLWKISKLSYKVRRKQEGIEFVKTLMEYKLLLKLSSAFIEGMYEQMYDDGKVHPNFRQNGTDSGRISCTSPNLQQMPKAEEDDKYQIRKLFIGSEYITNNDKDFVSDLVGVSKFKENFLRRTNKVRRKKIIAIDYKNLEMVVLTHFSKDPKLLHMFETGDDAHGSTAVNMFELDCTPKEAKKKYPHLRQAAKILNFLLMYGGGAYTLYNNLKEDHFSPIDLGSPEYLEKYHVKKGEDVAQIYIDKYFESYKGVADFIKAQKKFAHRNGYVLTLLGRKRRLPDINSNDFKKVAYCERLAVNSAVQGSAADITSCAQNRVDKDPWYKEHGINMIIQVHDELVFECPEKYVEECIERTSQYMGHPFGDNIELNVKLVADADSGNDYAEAK